MPRIRHDVDSRRWQFEVRHSASLIACPNAKGICTKVVPYAVKTVDVLRGQRILAVSGNTNVDDRDVLLEFKATTVQASPTVLKKKLLTTWNSTTDPNPCSGWAGVVCNTGQRVVVLDLSHMQLRGQISPVLANLSFLISFNLSNNEFYGKITSALSFLQRASVHRPQCKLSLWHHSQRFGKFEESISTFATSKSAHWKYSPGNWEFEKFTDSGSVEN